MPSSIKKILNSKYTAIAILLIVSIGVYLNTLPNEFVYDDKAQVLENKWIKDIRYTPDIFLTNVWAFYDKEIISNYYRPLMHIIYMIDYHIFGLKPWGFHLTNIIFHAGVTVLVFLIVSIFINQSSNPPILQSSNLQSKLLSPAFIAALLFAAHPIHTEAVTWVAGTPELLFTLFYLLSFYFYIYSIRDLSLNGKGSCKSIEETAFAVISRFNRGIQKFSVLKNTGFPIIPMYRDGKTNRDSCKNLRIKRKGFILSILFFFLAALCKEPALTLPILLLVYDYSISRSSVYSSRFTVHSIFKRYLPYLIVTIIYFILRIYAMGGFAPFKRHAQLSNYEYFINVFPLFIKYLEKLILPINLNAFYVFHPISSILQWKGIIALILTLGFVFLIYIFRRHKVVFLSLLWIVIPLLPVLYIPALGENTFTDRYLYLPSAGFVVLVSLAIERVYQLKVLRQSRCFGMVVISILVILTGLYSTGTIKRNYVWKDNYSLWIDTTKKSPDSSMAHNNMGNAYYKKGEINKAIEHYQIAIKLKPDYPEAHNNLGVAYDKKGETNKAIEHYEIAIKLNPNYDTVYNNLGVLYFEIKEIDKAIEHYQTALKLKPEDPDVRTNLGNAYSAQSKFDDAIKEYTIAIRLKPDHPEAHYNLALTYSKQGRFDEAIKEYTMAIKLKPDYIGAHYMLGLVYWVKGLTHLAKEEFEIALKLKPDFTPAREALESINRER